MVGGNALIRAVAGAVTATLLATSCGQAPNTAATPSATAIVASAETPRSGGSFVIAIAGDPQTLNLNLTTDTNASYAASGIFNGLVALDQNFLPTPDLAESWTVSPDGKRYDFKLAKNALFHDGTPVTSEDVRFSALDIAGKYLSLSIPIFKNIATVETPDANTIVFTLKAPSAIFLNSLGVAGLAVMPKKLYEGSDPRNNPYNSKPIGSGPFKFKEWVKGDHVTLVKNDRYFKKGLPYLDEHIARIIPDGGSRTIAFQKGDVDYIPGQIVTREQVPDLKKVAGYQEWDHAGAPGELLVYFNVTAKPFTDARVREAFVRAIDQKEIVEKAYFGVGAEVATSHIPKDLKAFHDPSVKLPAFDVAKANALLDDAGLKKGADGVRAKVRLAYANTDGSSKNASAVLRDRFTDIGVQTTIQVIDTTVVANSVFGKGDFDIFLAQVTSKGDPELGIARFYVTSSIGENFGNGSRYTNPEIDKAFADGGSTIDPAARKAAYARVQQILAKDLPTFPLVDKVNLDFARPEIGGVFQAPYEYYRQEVLWRRK